MEGSLSQRKAYPTVQSRIKPSQRTLELLRRSAEELLLLGLDDDEGWASTYLRKSQKGRWHAVSIELITKYIPAGKHVCDHGAAPFVLAQSLVNLGYKVTATDIAPDRFHGVAQCPFATVEEDLDAIRGNLTNSSFDAVIMNALFEHLRGDLIATAKYAYDTLKPGGKLFLCTPNLRSVGGIWNLLSNCTAFSGPRTLYKEWSKLHRIGHMGHVREYTAPEVCSLLEAVGFEIDGVTYHGSYRHGNRPKWFKAFAVGATAIAPSFLPHFTIIAKRPDYETRGGQ